MSDDALTFQAIMKVGQRFAQNKIKQVEADI